MSLVGWLLVALTLAGGSLLHLWNTYGTYDSAWLYVAIGMLVAAPGVAYVSRVAEDLNIWLGQAGIVALALLGAEIVWGMPCPDGGDCGAIGARGAFGVIGSILLVVVLAAVAWYLGRRLFTWADERRPSDGRTRVVTMVTSMLLSAFLVGVPLGVTLIAADGLLRPYPRYSRDAMVAVADFCFDLDQATPELEVRPSPEGLNSLWATYLVRRTDENRPALKGKLATSWPQPQSPPHPYEAVVAYDSNGDLEGNVQADLADRESGMTALECRRVSPTAGKVTKRDFAKPAFGGESPLKPNQLLTPPPPPTPPAEKPNK
jgi:hypothetical protein